MQRTQTNPDTLKPTTSKFKLTMGEKIRYGRKLPKSMLPKPGGPLDPNGRRTKKD